MDEAGTPAIEAVGVTFEVGAARLVDAVHLSVDAGQVIGILGPNGAGKSTLVKLVSGELAPTSGAVRLDGLPMERANDRPAEIPRPARHEYAHSNLVAFEPAFTLRPGRHRGSRRSAAQRGRADHRPWIPMLYAFEDVQATDDRIRGLRLLRIAGRRERRAVLLVRTP